MKKLLTISFKVWVTIAFAIATTAGALFLILRMNIEKTFTTKLTVDDENVARLVIKDRGAYLIKEQDKVSLFVNDEVVDSTIKEIEYDGDNDQYLMTLENIDKVLLPHTVLDAKIIYDEHTVLDALINPGV